MQGNFLAFIVFIYNIILLIPYFISHNLNYPLFYAIIYISRPENSLKGEI